MPSLQIFYIFVLRAEKVEVFAAKIVTFSARNTNIYKTCNIFRILEHFATKLCSFTNSKMSYKPVVKDFVFLAKTKI